MYVFTKKNKAKDPSELRPMKQLEIDFRKEMLDLYMKDSRAQTFVYRRIRRDEDGFPLLADEVKNNRSAEKLFKTNSSMKYLFDDYIVVGHFALAGYHESGQVKEYGDSRTEQKILFVDYNIISQITNNPKDIPDELDKVIIPRFDVDGNIISPLWIKEQYDIGSTEAYRLDESGRVEYVKINLLSTFDDSVTL